MARPKVRVFGTYQPDRTPLHGVDAKAKLLFLLFALIAAIASHSVLSLAIIVAAFIVALLLGHVSPYQLTPWVTPAGVLIAVCVVIGLAASHLGDALMIAARILVLLGFVLLTAATTTQTQLVDAAAQISLPGAAAGIASAVRAIPVAIEERNRLSAAQKARGGEGRVSFKMLSARVRANKRNLARAMARRGYDASSVKRSEHRMRAGDWLIIVAGIALVVVAVVL